jgi:hypothetical protein
VLGATTGGIRGQGAGGDVDQGGGGLVLDQRDGRRLMQIRAGVACYGADPGGGGGPRPWRRRSGRRRWAEAVAPVQIRAMAADWFWWSWASRGGQAVGSEVGVRGRARRQGGAAGGNELQLGRWARRARNFSGRAQLGWGAKLDLSFATGQG